MDEIDKETERIDKMVFDTRKIYYVYAWFFKSNGHIFHIGKGKGKRMFEEKAHRNQYFQNVLANHRADVDVRTLQENMQEKDALDLERQLIAKYKALGQCETNLHEGGCGGNTGNYDSESRSRKLSISGKRWVGPLNPMYGKKHTPEARRKMSEANKGKKLSPSHIQALVKANTGRVKTPEERAKLSKGNKGKKRSKEAIIKDVWWQVEHVYELYFKNQLVYTGLGFPRFRDLAEDKLGVSRTIVDRVANGTFVPKFKRHFWIRDIEVRKIPKDEHPLAEYLKYADNYEKFEQQFEVLLSEIQKCHETADLLRYGEVNPAVRK